MTEPSGKKRKRAVALAYDAPKDRAPRVSAKGSGLIAEKILQLANKHGIPIHEDPELVELLSNLDVEEEIPPELYVAIAEILAFIYSVNRRFKEKKDR
jgi:flagellar biosynthesis protein